MNDIPVNVIFILLLIAGSVWLQLILSKKDSKEPGLILPILSFVFSLVVTYNLMSADLGGYEVFVLIVSTFLLINILTIIYVTIYLLSKRAIKKKEKVRDLY